MKIWPKTAPVLYLLLSSCASPQVKQPSPDLKVLTWNVALRQIHENERIPALFREIRASDPDIICLQEVKPWFIEQLRRQDWISNYDTTFPLDGRQPPGMLLALSRKPILGKQYLPFPSRRGRKFLLFELELKGNKIGIGVIHFDSPLADADIRIQQLQVAAEYLERYDTALLAGDFNFGDSDPAENARIPSRFRDSWTMTKGKTAGFTWNNEENPLAREKALPGETSRRLDRIYTLSDSVKPSTMRIIGNRAVEPGGKIFPSDHYGLVADLQIAVKKTEVVVVERKVEKIPEITDEKITGLEILKDGAGFRLRLKTLKFDRGKIDLNSINLPLLEKVNALLHKYPDYRILVEGHTDDKGKEEYNRMLSEGRAGKVLDFLAEKGVKRERLSSVGLLGTRPLVPNTSFYNRSLNRRVELLLTRN